MQPVAGIPGKREFDDRDEQRRPRPEIGRFQQGLFFRRAEGRHHRQRIDEGEIAGLLDMIPLGIKPFGIELGTKCPDKTRPVHAFILTLGLEITEERRNGEAAERV